MKSFMRKVDRFCARNPRFGIPNLMLYLIIGNAIVWVLSMMDRSNTLVSLLALNPYYLMRGQIWRLVTFVFVPNSTDFWFLLMLYFYYFIGTTLERQWGRAKFTVYYICGMLFHIIYALVSGLVFGSNVWLTAYYLNMSMFFAFATMFPDTRVMLFFFIPIKIKWLAVINAAYFVIAIFQYFPAINFLPLVATLNYLLFCGGYLFDAVGRPIKAKSAPGAVNFRKEARKIRKTQKQQASQGFARKCAVCGKTDADNPSLEFRYCSRCGGYHCFCIDHINNHVHFTE